MDNQPPAATEPIERTTTAKSSELIDSLTTNRNPYEARTVYTERPNSMHAEDRNLSADELLEAQTLWDEAEAKRLAKSDQNILTLMSTNETREEPASKALENRLRIRFLSTKGATMQGWIAERDEIIRAELAGGKS